MITQRSSTPAASSDPTWRQRLTLLLAAAIAVGLALAGPIALPDGYHDFADRRRLLGIPHAADVLSNLPFLLAGLIGLARLPRHGRARNAWRVFFACIALTSIGSAYYHWAPDDLGLAFDRVPIAAACAALICAFVGERIDARAGRVAVLAVALVAATLTVPYAYWSPHWFGPGGDLRPYLLLQIWPLLMIPLLIFVYPRADERTLGNATWLAPLLLYLLAKGFEVADQPVLAATGVISGHTVKHLLAAAAALVFALGMPRASLRRSSKA